MPALANIAIADSVPATHTFIPTQSDNGKSEFANSSPGIPLGYELLDIQFVKPKSPSAAYRVIGKIQLPTIVTTAGVTTVTSKNTVNFDINLDQRSSSVERLNAVVLLQNLCANASFRSVVQNLENYY